MRLVVAGDRLDPPIGVPGEVYELMLCCWNTEAERRPKFAELITAFETLMRVNFLKFFKIFSLNLKNFKILFLDFYLFYFNF